MAQPIQLVVPSKTQEGKPDLAFQAPSSSIPKGSYQIVSILGQQGTGKSTLLNHVFGTRFEVLPKGHAPRPITQGVWMSAAATEPSVLVMDFEGGDNRSRNDNLDRKCAMFALTVADVVLFNIKEADTLHRRGGSENLLADLFKMMMMEKKLQEHIGHRRRKLLAVIRDVGETRTEVLRDRMTGQFDKIWKTIDADKPPEYKFAALNEFLQIDIFTMPPLKPHGSHDSRHHSVTQGHHHDSHIPTHPHPQTKDSGQSQPHDHHHPPAAGQGHGHGEEQAPGQHNSPMKDGHQHAHSAQGGTAVAHSAVPRDAFDQKIRELRDLLMGNHRYALLQKDQGRPVTVESLRSLWEGIQQSKLCNLPSYEAMLADVRCREVCRRQVDEFGSLLARTSFGSAATRHLLDCIAKYKEETQAFCTFEAYEDKRRKLLEDMLTTLRQAVHTRVKEQVRIAATRYEVELSRRAEQLVSAPTSTTPTAAAAAGSVRLSQDGGSGGSSGEICVSFRVLVEQFWREAEEQLRAALDDLRVAGAVHELGEQITDWEWRDEWAELRQSLDITTHQIRENIIQQRLQIRVVTLKRHIRDRIRPVIYEFDHGMWPKVIKICEEEADKMAKELEQDLAKHGLKEAEVYGDRSIHHGHASQPALTSFQELTNSLSPHSRPPGPEHASSSASTPGGARAGSSGGTAHDSASASTHGGSHYSSNHRGPHLSIQIQSDRTPAQVITPGAGGSGPTPHTASSFPLGSGSGPTPHTASSFQEAAHLLSTGGLALAHEAGRTESQQSAGSVHERLRAESQLSQASLANHEHRCSHTGSNRGTPEARRQQYVRIAYEESLDRLRVFTEVPNLCLGCLDKRYQVEYDKLQGRTRMSSKERQDAALLAAGKVLAQCVMVTTGPDGKPGAVATELVEDFITQFVSAGIRASATDPWLTPEEQTGALVLFTKVDVQGLLESVRSHSEAQQIFDKARTWERVRGALQRTMWRVLAVAALVLGLRYFDFKAAFAFIRHLLWPGS